jgi:hypothetical protein
LTRPLVAQAKFARSLGGAFETAFYESSEKELARLTRALTETEHENNLVTFASEATPAEAAAALPEPAVIAKPIAFEPSSASAPLELAWQNDLCIIQ